MPVLEVFPPRDRSHTAVETVVSTIRQLLIDRKLKPGDLLPSENEIASTLAISRGSIREAMKILSAFGVVEIRRGNGTYVATSSGGMLFDPLLFNLLVTSREIGELAELRSLVEEGVIRLIIDRAGDSDFDGIEKICAEMAANEACAAGGAGGAREAGEVPEALLPPASRALFDIDKRYHTELGRLTHNRLVANVYTFVIDLLAPTMRPGFGTETHLKLARALRERNLSLALDMVREHDDVWRFLNHEGLDNEGSDHEASISGQRQNHEQ